MIYFINLEINIDLINELLGNILNIKKLVKLAAFSYAKKVAAYNKKWDNK